MRRYRLFRLVLLVSLALASPPRVGAEPCFSTLSADMKIRVPAIKFADTFFEAEFDLLAQGPAGEGGAWLLLQQIRAANLLSCSNPAVFFQDSAINILRIPLLQFNADSYWADLEYTPTSDNKVWLKLLAAGLVSTSASSTTSGQGLTETGRRRPTHVTIGRMAPHRSMDRAGERLTGPAGPIRPTLSARERDKCICTALRTHSVSVETLTGSLSRSFWIK